MKNLENSPAFQVALIDAIIFPATGKISPVKIKSIYHLFQLSKKVDRKEFTDISQGKELICEKGKFGRTQFTKFINSPDFQLFGKVIHRNNGVEDLTNLYELHDWVKSIFRFFEKVGMMQGFRNEFERWRCRIKRRLRKWLLPLLEAGKTFSQILENRKLVNKLSTKTVSKPTDPTLSKPTAIKHTSYMGSIKPSRESKSKQELPAIRGFCQIAETLSVRFSIRDGDLNMIMNSFSLKEIKSGLRMRENWKANGFQAKSEIGAFLACMRKNG
jgi:hypothetical protein